MTRSILLLVLSLFFLPDYGQKITGIDKPLLYSDAQTINPIHTGTDSSTAGS